jgi:uncharacterized protein with HEPN domain
MDARIEKSLYDILAAIASIDSYLAERGRNFNRFCADGLLRHGIERNLEIIGEATNRILKTDPAFPITKARKIVDMRNYVIHGYDSLRPETLWGIVIKDLPPLKTEIDKLLG